MKRYYNIAQVSSFLGRSRQLLNYWAKKSGVKKTKGGYKFTEEDIEVIKIRIGFDSTRI